MIIMILHTSVNFWGDIFRPLFTGPDVMKQEIWLTVAYVGAAVLLALVAGRELGRKPAAEAETMLVAEQPPVGRPLPVGSHSCRRMLKIE